ncbi:MAG: hypothetical protein U0354_01335 [Candidatus Sericytochromatia bacterium]
MDKKPKLLDKKRVIICCDSPINQKILDQSIKGIEYEPYLETNMVKLLAKIFMYEPKLVILAHDSIISNIEFTRHIRNNPYFNDLPVICISETQKKENMSIKNKISSLNIISFTIPVNNLELTKFIRQFLDN